MRVSAGWADAGVVALERLAVVWVGVAVVIGPVTLEVAAVVELDLRAVVFERDSVAVTEFVGVTDALRVAEIDFESFADTAFVGRALVVAVVDFALLEAVVAVFRVADGDFESPDKVEVVVAVSSMALREVFLESPLAAVVVLLVALEVVGAVLEVLFVVAAVALPATELAFVVAVPSPFLGERVTF